MSTVRDLLTDAKRRIAPVSTSASLDAQLLLAEVLGCDRAHILAHPETVLTPAQVAQVQAFVARRAGSEPMAYILGRKAFYDREFVVTPAVLIPRPETEHLLEMALAFVRQHPALDDALSRGQALPCPATETLNVVDVGTGSGALAVTLAHAPGATVYATDTSPDALAVARLNAQKHNVEVVFFEGDMLLPLIEADIRVDLIMANLPYIATDDMPALAVSKHEPHQALDGGAEGLDLIRRLLSQAPGVIRTGGMILLEIGADQGAAVQQLAQEMPTPPSVTVHKDYAGQDRVVRIRV
jgi:release factor glutamine methyltransferase